jgi:hypothetical protein
VNTALEQQYRNLRIMHAAMFAAAIMYLVLLGWMFADLKEDKTDITFAVVFGACSTALVGITLSFRKRWMAPVERAEPHAEIPQEQMMQWHQAQMLSFAAAEAVALFGFVLRFLGHPWIEASAFFTASFILFVIFVPRKPASLTQ